MKRCKNCKWWKRDGIGSWGQCILAGSSHGLPDHTESLATAHDAESYGAYLETYPDFGCVQWEKRVV